MQRGDRPPGHALPGRAGQRVRHLERVRQPVLAGEVPHRRARAGALRALRRGRVRGDRGGDPHAARRGRRRARLGARRRAARAGSRRSATARRPRRTSAAPARRASRPSARRTARTTTPRPRRRELPQSVFSLGGRWHVDRESARAVRGATITARVVGGAVYLVLSSDGDRPRRVRVELDGRPIAARRRRRRRPRRRRHRPPPAPVHAREARLAPASTC